MEVVAFLRGQGVDVASIYERDLALLTDEDVLAVATAEDRFVLTHDSDFGRMVLHEGRPFHGVIFLRPGDDPPDVVIAGLPRLLEANVDWKHRRWRSTVPAVCGFVAQRDGGRGADIPERRP